MSNIKLGLIGCGAAAKQFYLPALKKHPELADNIFLVDKNINLAQQAAKELGSNKVFENYQDIIGKVDGVIIAVPHQFHFSISMDFLNNKTNVLCEKPIAETSEEAQKMVDAANNNGVYLALNYTRRVFPSFLKIKELIKNGDIGDLISIQYFEAAKFNWESATNFYVNPNLSDKGILMDLGAHVLDLVCWFLNGKPEVKSFEDDSFGGPESVALLKAQKGKCNIEIKLNRLVSFDNYFKIKGTIGTISGSTFDWNRLKIDYSNGKGKNIHLKTKAIIYPNFVGIIVDNFINSLLGKENPFVLGHNVIDSIKLIEESYRNRKRFKLPWYENLEVF